MTVTKKPFGLLSDGTEVERFVVENSAGIVIEAISYGATLTSCRLPDRSGSVGEVTLGFETLEAYLADHPFFGATIGRFANRISNARFTLDGKQYDLTKNHGAHQLHGGSRGFNRVAWEAEAFGNPENAGVIFSRRSPDGEEGYPGNLDIRVTFTLTEDGELSFEYEAVTDQPTVVNLTNHSYWNLAGEKAGSVSEHEVRLNCDFFLPTDNDSIPTGEISPVEGTPMDFTSGKTVGRDWRQVRGASDAVFGYDHCFVVRGEGRRALGSVTDPATGRAMDIETTQPGVQFYTGNLLQGRIGRGERKLSAHDALCLETQAFPDAPNKPQFPSAILRPGETYRHTTTHRFYTV